MRVALRTSLDDTQDFLQLEEMSRGMRRVYDRTVQRFRAPGTIASAPGIVPKLPARIIINGREFGSSTQMPVEFRRFYEEALVRALPVQRAIRIVAEAEHANSIKRISALTLIAAGCAAAIVYLALHGYYA